MTFGLGATMIKPDEVEFNQDLYLEYKDKLDLAIKNGLNSLNIPISYSLAKKLAEDLSGAGWTCQLKEYAAHIKLRFAAAKVGKEDVTIIKRENGY